MRTAIRLLVVAIVLGATAIPAQAQLVSVINAQVQSTFQSNGVTGAPSGPFPLPTAPAYYNAAGSQTSGSQSTTANLPVAVEQNSDGTYSGDITFPQAGSFSTSFSNPGSLEVDTQVLYNNGPVLPALPIHEYCITGEISVGGFLSFSIDTKLTQNGVVVSEVGLDFSTDGTGFPMDPNTGMIDINTMMTTEPSPSNDQSAAVGGESAGLGDTKIEGDPAYFSVTDYGIVSAPEPSSLALLGLGAVGVAGRLWRRR